MNIKNIIFDLDNTLYSCTSEMDRGITQRMMNAIAEFFGVSIEEAVELRKKNLPRFSTSLEWLRSEGFSEIESYFAKVHPDNEADELPFDKNLRPLLESLKPIIQKKIILTNAPREHADRVLKKLNVADLFPVIIDIRACGLLGKPYPQSYKTALTEIGGSIDDTIFLDDQYKYTDGFAALGGTAVLVGEKNGGHLDKQSAAYNKETPPHPGRTLKIRDIYELPDLLKKL